MVAASQLGMKAANVFLTPDDEYFLYDFATKQLYSKQALCNIAGYSPNRFPVLNPKDRRFLQQGTNMILPRTNKIIIQLDRIPVILVRSKPYGYTDDYMHAYIFTGDGYAPQGQRLIDNFEKLLYDVSQTSAVSELSILEVLLAFISGSLNEEYQRILLQYNQFNYLNHAQTNNQLSLMKTQCSHVIGLLEDIISNQSQLALLVFANYDILAQQSQGYSYNQSNSISRGGSIPGSLNKLSGSVQLLGPYVRLSTGSRAYSSDNLKALSQQQIKSAKNVEEIEDALDSYQTQFQTIQNEIAEMQSKMELYLQQAQIRYDMERNYIVEFALKQKITNVSLTATSLFGALFGQNFAFRFGFDNEQWTSISPIPFVCLLLVSLAAFAVTFTTIMLNYRKRSMLHASASAQKHVPRRRFWRKSKGYTTLDGAIPAYGNAENPRHSQIADLDLLE